MTLFITLYLYYFILYKNRNSLLIELSHKRDMTPKNRDFLIIIQFRKTTQIVRT